MNKTELLNRFSADQEERLVLARVLDQMERAQSRSIPCSTQFLSPAQRAAVEPLLAACGHPKHLFAGGWAGAVGGWVGGSVTASVAGRVTSGTVGAGLPEAQPVSSRAHSSIAANFFMECNSF